MLHTKFCLQAVGQRFLGQPLVDRGNNLGRPADGRPGDLAGVEAARGTAGQVRSALASEAAVDDARTHDQLVRYSLVVTALQWR